MAESLPRQAMLVPEGLSQDFVMALRPKTDRTANQEDNAISMARSRKKTTHRSLAHLVRSRRMQRKHGGVVKEREGMRGGDTESAAG